MRQQHKGEQKLAIIIVNYKNYKVTQEFIDCFKNQTNKNFRIFVADLSDEKKSLNLFDFAEVISGINRGYSSGFNIGLKKALDQKYSLFANIGNDTRVNNNFVDCVLKVAQKYPFSLIGAKIYYEKGYEYDKSRYKENELGHVLWYAGGIIDWNNVFTKHIGVDEIDHGQYDKPTETDFVTGCFVLFDRDVFNKVGFWDEKYFLYYEDADFNERAKRKGIKLYFEPSIVLWHKNAQSSGGSGSLLQQKYQPINHLRFGLKYAPFKTKLHLLKNYLLRLLK